MRRAFPALLVLLAACASAEGAPYVVVFASPATCSDCPSALGLPLRKKGFEVKYAGPGGATKELLAGASMYLIPGGEDCDKMEDCPTAEDRENIRAFVANGGIFYGVCLGGYWAGDWPGANPKFEPLRISGAHVLAFSKTPQERLSRLEPVSWEGKKRWLFYQDGPSFVLGAAGAGRVHDTEVVATYDNPAFQDAEGRPTVAAFITGYGRGVVAISGVHLEAPDKWQDEGTVRQTLKELKVSSAEFSATNARMMSGFLDRILLRAKRGAEQAPLRSSKN